MSIESKHTELKRNVNRILIFKRFTFFNIMLHKFNWELDYNCPEDALGYIKFKPQNLDELDTGSIYINAKMIEKFTTQNYLFLLVHEFMHITFNHHLRMGDRDPMIWNLAGDHVINQTIKRSFSENEIAPLGGYGEGGCVLFPDQEIQGPHVTTEQVYDFLVQDKYRFTVISVQGKGSKDSQGGNGKNMNVTSITVRDNKTGETHTVDISEKNGSRDFENFNRVAGEIFNQIKDRGDFSGNLYEVFSNLYKTEIPWTEILRDAIHKSLTPLPNSRGWKTLNKLFMPLGYTLPGITYDMEENADVGVISIDSSGSVSSKELNEFASILVESIVYFKKIILIVHDHEIQQKEEFNRDDGPKLKSFLAEIGFKGRGGTSHQDVFNEIQKIDDQLDEGASMYLSLTDGFSDIDESWNQNTWSKNRTIPTYFIITKDGREPNIVKENKYDNVKSIKINNV